MTASISVCKIDFLAPSESTIWLSGPFGGGR